MDSNTKKGMASSATSEWATPEVVLEPARKVNKIALDPCSNAQSLVKATREVLLPENGLRVDWGAEIEQVGGGQAFVNPPYGKFLKEWVRKCVIESARGTEIILLIAARTDTKYFQKWIFPTAQAVCFWEGRIKFISPTGVKDGAFFPSAVVYWGPNSERFVEAFEDKGACFITGN